MKPVIGVTLDFPKDDGYSKRPWYALRADYIQAFAKLGAEVRLLHYEWDDVEALAKSLDGLVVTGGNFDVDPAYYGEEVKSEKVKINSKRSSFERAILEAAIKFKLPTFGICGGEQLLNAIMGGTLIQHIPDEVPNCLVHEQPFPKDKPTHKVNVVAGTMLHKITGENEFMVNTTHHQAVKSVAEGFVVNAVAPDGVIEGIETKDQSWFCLGVQWHPEYANTEADMKLLSYFVNECRKPKA